MSRVAVNVTPVEEADRNTKLCTRVWRKRRMRPLRVKQRQRGRLAVSGYLALATLVFLARPVVAANCEYGCAELGLRLLARDNWAKVVVVRVIIASEIYLENKFYLG